MKKILVVDDDAASCELLKEIFQSQGWQVETANTPDAALNLADKHNFDLLVSDVNLEANKTGLDLLKEMRTRCPVILVTGFGTLETAVEASREGAWDFISKPFKVAEVIMTARRALEKTTPEIQEERDVNQISSKIVGRTPEMIALYKEIARVAPTRSTVLILGESGTGKELVARSIHQNSPRAHQQFIAVNCGALTETLLESELFGYVRGAFTGANTDRRGLWEEADAGTLFLDEIGETSQAMQVKLLRALQEGEIRRVGSTQTRKVDTRIVAATNRNLEKEVEAGRFREDLFYRLSVVTLEVPPLRVRRADIPLLAERFLQKAMANVEKKNLRFSEEVLKLLSVYEWRGNVRELETAIEYAAIRVRGNEILPEDLPTKLNSSETREAAARFHLQELYADLPSLDELEKRYLQHVLEATSGNRSRTAEILGIDRRTLYRMAERFNLGQE
ncbi:MAG: sigma-54 dependent transcriptional regulator [Pyrinomonadaceae bacterium]